MNSTYRVNPRRLLLLIRSSIFISRNLILVLAAVFSAFLILIAVKDTFTGSSTDLYRNMYSILLFVSGFVVTLGIARELQDKRKGGTWLLLPASTMEKFLSLLLLPTLILICGAAVYMTAMSFVIESGISIFTSSCHKIFNPFGSDIYIRTVIYIVVQSPFLLGALYFKKHAISFTFLSLFIYWVILSVFTSFAGKMLLNAHFAPLTQISGPMASASKLYFMTIAEQFRQFWGIWKPVVRIILEYALPLVCWITAFFSLKEMEQ